MRKITIALNGTFSIENAEKEIALLQKAVEEAKRPVTIKDKVQSILEENINFNEHTDEVYGYGEAAHLICLLIAQRERTIKRELKTSTYKP